MQHPLFFLTIRSFVNGLRRAVSSGRRIISLIFFAVYYIFFLGRQSFRPDPAFPRTAHTVPQLALPPVSSIEAVIFLVFVAMTVLMSPRLLSYRGGFKQADVDVLFATPVEPRTVLVFRMLRDYFLTLLIPLFFGLVSWRPTSEGFRYVVENYPKLGGYVFKAGWLAWMLTAMTWVAMGYAAGMFVNRSDLVSNHNRKRIGWTIFGLITVCVAYASLRLRVDPSWETIVSVTQSPFIRVVFFTATAATQIVMTTISGNFVYGGLGVLALVAVIVASVKIAMTQAAWMYDQAAARGFDDVSTLSMRRRGDTFGIMAEQARKGKIKTGRFATWIGRSTISGPAALLWKESIIQARGALWQSLIFLPLAGMLVAVPVWTAGHLSADAVGKVYLGSLGILVLITGLSSQPAFMEMLRRVDIEKPLPFTPTAIVFWEVMSKAIPTVVIAFAAAVVSVAIRPELWVFGIASLIGAPCLAVVVVSPIFLITVLFPDFDDPTQRGFRQMMLLLGVAAFAGPGIVLYLGGLYFELSPLLITLVVGIVDLAISLLCCMLAGNIYAGYNPSE